MCSDPEGEWAGVRSVCYATMMAAGKNALYAKLHEKKPYHDGTFTKWAATCTARTPYHFSAGVTIWVSPIDLNPDDDFLTAKPGY